MAPTSTTALSWRFTRLRKYAVSSSVSVPWVITTPATEASWESVSTRCASERQTSCVMFWLPTLATCSARISAMPASCGTAASRSFTEKVPDL